MHYLFLYNSFDPGHRMNKINGKKINIYFLEQYYWKHDILRLETKRKKWSIKSRGSKIINMPPDQLLDNLSNDTMSESYFG